MLFLIISAISTRNLLDQLAIFAKKSRNNAVLIKAGIIPRNKIATKNEKNFFRYCLSLLTKYLNKFLNKNVYQARRSKTVIMIYGTDKNDRITSVVPIIIRNRRSAGHEYSEVSAVATSTNISATSGGKMATPSVSTSYITTK